MLENFRANVLKEAGKGILQHARAQSTHALLRRTRQLNESKLANRKLNLV